MDMEVESNRQWLHRTYRLTRASRDTLQSIRQINRKYAGSPMPAGGFSGPVLTELEESLDEIEKALAELNAPEPEEQAPAKQLSSTARWSVERGWVSADGNVSPWTEWTVTTALLLLVGVQVVFGALRLAFGASPWLPLNMQTVVAAAGGLMGLFLYYCDREVNG